MRDKDVIMDKEVIPKLLDTGSLGEGCWRVKIFELNAENNWSNLGTGIASILRDVFSLLTLGRELLYTCGFRNWQRRNPKLTDTRLHRIFKAEGDDNNVE